MKAVESVVGELDGEQRDALRQVLQDRGVVAPEILVDVVDMLVEGQNDPALRKLSSAMNGET